MITNYWSTILKLKPGQSYKLRIQLLEKFRSDGSQIQNHLESVIIYFTPFTRPRESFTVPANKML